MFSCVVIRLLPLHGMINSLLSFDLLDVFWQVFFFCSAVFFSLAACQVSFLWLPASQSLAAFLPNLHQICCFYYALLENHTIRFARIMYEAQRAFGFMCLDSGDTVTSILVAQKWLTCFSALGCSLPDTHGVSQEMTYTQGRYCSRQIKYRLSETKHSPAARAQGTISISWDKP